MLESMTIGIKRVYYHLKQRIHPSLLDLEYRNDLYSGKPFATPEIIEDYIERGADPNEERRQRGNKYSRPLFRANAADNASAFFCLSSHGAYIRTDRGEVDFLLRNCGSTEIRNHLLKFQAEQEQKNSTKVAGKGTSEMERIAAARAYHTSAKNRAAVAELRRRKGDEPQRKEVNKLLQTIEKTMPPSRNRRTAARAVVKDYRERHPKKRQR